MNAGKTTASVAEVAMLTWELSHVPMSVMNNIELAVCRKRLSSSCNFLEPFKPQRTNIISEYSLYKGAVTGFNWEQIMGILVLLKSSCHQKDSFLVCFRRHWNMTFLWICGFDAGFCLFLSFFPPLNYDASTMECFVLIYRAVSTSNLATCLLRSERLIPSTYHQIQSDLRFSPSFWLMDSDTLFPVLPFVIPHQKRRSTKRILDDVWWHSRKSV